MRVAISAESDNGLESATSVHFGRCPYFVLVDLEGQEVKQVRTVANPYYGHHQPGQVPAFIHSQEVDIMLTGGIGGRAIAFFEQYGIQTATGAAGTAKQALEHYLQGQLSAAEPCQESVEHGHGGQKAQAS